MPNTSVERRKHALFLVASQAIISIVHDDKLTHDTNLIFSLVSFIHSKDFFRAIQHDQMEHICGINVAPKVVCSKPRGSVSVLHVGAGLDLSQKS